jgi:hypothetical protein
MKSPTGVKHMPFGVCDAVHPGLATMLLNVPLLALMQHLLKHFGLLDTNSKSQQHAKGCGGASLKITKSESQHSASERSGQSKKKRKPQLSDTPAAL